MKKITAVLILLCCSAVLCAADMETVFEDLAEKTAPSTVLIQSEGEATVSAGGSPFGGFDFGLGDLFAPFTNPRKEVRKTVSSGTGFVVRQDGYIMTNAHVVADSSKVTVTLYNGKEYDGTVLLDSFSDLALVKIDATGLTPLAFADSDKLKVGQWVMAIGNPMGFENTVTVGVVSGLTREFSVGEGDSGTFYPDAIQTDATINPGNSGGPLINTSGQVIGVNAAIASTTGASIGIGFAIPANTAKFVMERLLSEGKVVRGFLGLAPANMTPYHKERLKVSEGVYVASVTDDSPAGRAGIKVEDVITAFDGKKVTSAIELRRAIQAAKPDTTVNVDLVRKGEKQTVKVTVGLLHSGDDNKTITGKIDLGMKVAELTPEVRNKLKLPSDFEGGVLVQQLLNGGAAAQAGIKAGDVILEIDGDEIKDVNAFNRIAASLKKGSHITVIVWRQGSTYACDLAV
ncbi:MAG: trypsin-like peptidase domain-containing protein [Abditibacteriota bacterium]|nr:trypsin-like peptidase domain-containing protein [Abditibacteriota bacterium]